MSVASAVDIVLGEAESLNKETFSLNQTTEEISSSDDNGFITVEEKTPSPSPSGAISLLISKSLESVCPAAPAALQDVSPMPEVPSTDKLVPLIFLSDVLVNTSQDSPILPTEMEEKDIIGLDFLEVDGCSSHPPSDFDSDAGSDKSLDELDASLLDDVEPNHEEMEAYIKSPPAQALAE